MILKLSKSLILMMLMFVLTLGTSMNLASAATTPDPNTELAPIQQYELKSDKIVKVVPNNDAFQKEALSWLNSATNLSTQLSLDDKCGSIYKVPLKKEVTKEFKGLTFVVSDIFLIYCPEKEPLLLVFNKERKPFLLLFSSDVKPFIKMIDNA
ncbi:hypothetical protein BVG16_31655 [Paenibacillus selenitireducens]|uniref:Type IV secretion system protein VirB6 n=1 Tax=Paenibacillus selenitireducens TaxID=1324314 RepID=A0A1T2WZ29_9BACL|nr:hypothetical protein [Paenibacillus selenitireducens]OPA72874.1 hypothetical protein BVG16_31655 [Paenibacillus selenitireducens]